MPAARAHTLLVLLVACWPAAGHARRTEWRSEAEAKGHVPADLPLPATPRRANEPGGRQRQPIVRHLVGSGRDAVALPGALSGKSIYLSPGHGWTYSSSGWGTQRPNITGLVEDLSNTDGLTQFLVQYLWNAGALVVPVRELDPNPNLVILDNGDGTSAPTRGLYRENGDAAKFSDSLLAGWGHPTLPLTGTVNPFSLGKNRLIAVTPNETASATFIPAVPASGYYFLSISYSMHSSRASDARVTVLHPGGKTVFLVDQRRQGGSWLLLGRFYFEAGTNETRGAVVISNQSQDDPATATVSVDAVRLGGGMGLCDRGGGVSKQPRADESCRYTAQFSGAPSTVYDSSTSDDHTDDVSCRSRFAAWLHADGEPALFLSHHSNASGGSARGTESYVYGPNAPDGTYQPTAATLALGSDKLAKTVHAQVISDLRAGFDPAWTDRKVLSAYFGELNTSYQNEMPSMLIEVAFHDQPDDIAALKQAAFRRVLARALYKGMVKHFADRDGVSPAFLPDPPVQISARNGGQGTVTVSWSPGPTGGIHGDAATSYRVLRSSEGRAFDEGQDTAGKTSLTLSGLTPGQVIYLRVLAANAGGVSLPSPTLAVGVGQSPQSSVLLVTGFTRLDASMNLHLTAGSLGEVERLYLERMNDGSYLVEHGQALGPSGVAFDACTHDAVETKAIDLQGYSLVLWQAGKGIAAGKALGAASLAALQAAPGVGVILSGSGVAAQLGTSASAEDNLFLSDRLGSKLAGAGEAPSSILFYADKPLAGLETCTLSGPTSGPYDVQSVDGLAATGSGVLAATYSSSKGAIVLRREGGSCAALLGFPLETALPAARQAELVKRLLDYCQLKPPVTADGALLDGARPDARADAGTAPPSSGCGCEVAAARRDAAGALALLLLLAAASRWSRTHP
jgi:hypothetical protein